MFNKVTIIGVGLIGGSLGLGIKKNKLAKVVAGICRRKTSAKAAVKNGVCDIVTLDYKEGLAGAELVIIASPVGKIVDIAKKVVAHTKGEVILTDVGSTKSGIVRQIEKMAPESVKFVGSHPMAGSEKNGVGFAVKNLFENSICIVTKTKKTDKKAFLAVKRFWENLGATVSVLSPEEHDARVSLVSHLPHAAAYALSGMADAKSLKFASTGFKDTTRIASSDPYLWHDIFMTNRKALLSALAGYRAALRDIEKCIRNGSSKRLIGVLKKAKGVRDKL
jgi:prephenate dehydrogenase